MMMLFPFVFITLVLFALGCVVGSFLNVVVYRTVEQRSWVTGRSKCESCDHQIRWFDNIPLLSYLLLRGKCRDCGASISMTHPVIELLTGSLFVWWYWFGAFFFQLTHAPFQMIQPLFWLLVGILLLLIVIADISYYIIPDTIVVMLFVLTILYRIALVGFGVMQVSDLVWSLVAMTLAFLFFASLWLITNGKGFGMGDVKLVVPLALLLGWQKIFVGLFLAFLFGATVGVLLILLGKKRFGEVIPFGPFLVLGSITALIFGQNLLEWYMALL